VFKTMNNGPPFPSRLVDIHGRPNSPSWVAETDMIGSILPLWKESTNTKARFSDGKQDTSSCPSLRCCSALAMKNKIRFVMVTKG